MITLATKYLKAAILTAGDRDVRPYLNGVYVEVRPARVKFCSTNGHSAFYANQTVKHNTPDMEIIIPRETVVTVLKNKPKDFVTLEISEAGFFLGDVRFKPVDGHFPDVRRVLVQEVSGEAAFMFDPKLYSDVIKAVATATGDSNVRVFQNGQGAAVIKGTDPNSIAILMPMRLAKSMEDIKFDGFAW